MCFAETLFGRNVPYFSLFFCVYFFQTRYHCNICNIWIDDNPRSRRNHDQGQKHKDAYERFIELSSLKNKQAREAEKEKQAFFASLEKAAAENLNQSTKVKREQSTTSTSKSSTSKSSTLLPPGLSLPPGLETEELVDPSSTSLLLPPGLADNDTEYDIDSFIADKADVQRSDQDNVKGQSTQAPEIGRWEVVAEASLSPINESDVTSSSALWQDKSSFGVESVTPIAFGRNEPLASNKRTNGHIMTLDQVLSSGQSGSNMNLKANALLDLDEDVEEVSFKKKKKKTK